MQDLFISNDRINNELYYRIKEKIIINDYCLIRQKENEKYITFEVFGYNGEQLYIKQTIGIKKD